MGVLGPGGDDNSQIFRLSVPGGQPQNLTGDPTVFDHGLDVSEDGSRILLKSFGRPEGEVGTYVMQTDGTNAVRQLSFGVGRGRWFREGSRVFAFNKGDNDHSSIHLYDIEDTLFAENPDQVTFPSEGETDFGGFDIAPGSKHVLFSRRNVATGESDLFRKYFWNDDPPVNLTNSPGVDESFPVVSHDERLFAFRAVNAATGAESIRVMNLAPDGTLSDHSEIALDPSEYERVSRVEFSADDQCVIVTSQVKSVPAAIPKNREEILVIDLETQVIERLTDNTTNESAAIPIPLAD